LEGTESITMPRWCYSSRRW